METLLDQSGLGFYMQMHLNLVYCSMPSAIYIIKSSQYQNIKIGIRLLRTALLANCMHAIVCIAHGKYQFK